MPKASPTDRRVFWERKILTWDHDRYDPPATGASLLARAQSRLGTSIRHRMELALAALTPHLEGKRVIELGCGTGRLAPLLIERGAAEYVGYDLAEGAVARASDGARSAGFGDRVRFEQIDVSSLRSLDSDIVVSLGLLDWLDDGQIEHVFELGRGTHFLHSFSEARRSFVQAVHSAYVFVAYGHASRGYVPAYHQASMLASMARARGASSTRFVRDPRLSFGTFITSLSDDS